MAGLELERQVDSEFLSIPLRPSTMTFYTPRTSILEAVRRETAGFYGSVLDVGCGFMPYRKLVEAVPAVERYIGMDLEQRLYYAGVEPDLKWDGSRIPVDDQNFDCVMATEFLEHYAEPETIMKEILRVLKPSGRFFATVPFIWNLHELPYDEYRYTPFSLERHLRNAGFQEIKVEALGGWNMAFAQMIGLWIGFSPMNRLIRRMLRVLLFPVYWYLIKSDRKLNGFDGFERSMYPGLSITARR